MVYIENGSSVYIQTDVFSFKLKKLEDDRLQQYFFFEMSTMVQVGQLYAGSHRPCLVFTP